MKKILVTGGAGFIGSHLVEALVREGHAVRVLDSFVTGHPENLRERSGEIELVAGDCADPSTAAYAVEGVDVVFHEAALPSVARSLADPLGSHSAGGTATLTMLVAARDAGVRRFIYAGSSSVYGDCERLPKREDMTPRPLSIYAAGKLLGEHYVRIFAQLYGMQTVTLRYFNVFGPRQDGDSPYSAVISRFATALLEGEAPVLNGDGLQSRDFTYVDNVVVANLLALAAEGLAGQAVNIATGGRITLLDLLAILAEESGRSVEPRHAPARPGDVRHSLADISLAYELLGYRPVVDLRTGLRRTLEWQQARRARTFRAAS